MTNLQTAVCRNVRNQIKFNIEHRPSKQRIQQIGYVIALLDLTSEYCYIAYYHIDTCNHQSLNFPSILDCVLSPTDDACSFPATYRICL